MSLSLSPWTASWSLFWIVFYLAQVVRRFSQFAPLAALYGLVPWFGRKRTDSVSVCLSYSSHSYFFLPKCVCVRVCVCVCVCLIVCLSFCLSLSPSGDCREAGVRVRHSAHPSPLPSTPERDSGANETPLSFTGFCADGLAPASSGRPLIMAARKTRRHGQRRVHVIAALIGSHLCGWPAKC